MPRGGKRAGAGMKPGGVGRGNYARPEAIRNLAKSRVQEVLKTQHDPVAVLVELANDTKLDPVVRVQAATAAAPYIFPRLSATVVTTASSTPSKEDHAHLIERIMGKLGKLPSPPLIESEAA